MRQPAKTSCKKCLGTGYQCGYGVEYGAKCDCCDPAPAAPQPLTEYRIVFDGFPSPEGPRFVEVEDVSGKSVNAGQWRKRPDGFCELVIKVAGSAAP